MVDRRQNPDQLLRRAQEDERRERRGKLKIYLGAAPGVGKTHQMLHDALQKRAKGLDVVVGVAESHGRREINAMLQHLEILPRQIVHYRGTKLFELDLDAILKRSPGLILIDEMAHTNAPGLRHIKRWQDITEVLDRGIDVYTTLNVQHIESLNDDVAQIIQAPVKETVPDSMLELADTIELIDLPPDDLLKRLQEGKIYIPQQAELASEHFFRKGNLIALRELALRATAEHVGAEVLMYRQGEGIKRIWSTKETILVCVGPHSDSLKLIRTAKRVATSLQAEWLAVYVDKPTLQRSDIKRNQAIKNLHMAELLGAETHVLTGFDIVNAIMGFAHDNNVTQIMVWKTIYPRWLDWFHRHAADEIVRQSGEINVCIVTGEPSPGDKINEKQKLTKKLPTPWKIYGMTFGIVTFATILNFLLSPVLVLGGFLMIYFLGIVGVALLGRLGPSVFASLLSIAAYNFFFVIPFYDFSMVDANYIFTIVLMFFVSQVISQLIILTRREVESARIIQYQTSALYALSRQLTSAWGVEQLLETGTRYIANAFGSEILVLLPHKGHLVVQAYSKAKQKLSPKEQSIAEWVYEAGKMAGLGTETLAFSKALYLPLLTPQGPLGVIRVCPETAQLLTPEQMRLLESCVNQLALALDVDRLQEKATQKEWKLESERIRSALLQTISQNLRTPLITVIGAASHLIGREGMQIGAIEKDIYFEIEQLSRFNNNMLQITQLESQSIKLNKKPISVKVVIFYVVKKFDKFLKNRSVIINAPDNVPPVAMNESLLQEVLVNLIDNAVKYSPPGSSIYISVKAEPRCALVSVEDCGPGILPDEAHQLFEKFYRGKQATANHGLGLGLAICQKIIKVHGGEIWAENRSKGGAAFRFTLPLSEE